MYLRMTFWTPAVAYAGFLLAGGANVPNKMGFMGALLGFLLAIMFTLRELRRERATTGPSGLVRH
jgi:hypothetical protein